MMDEKHMSKTQLKLINTAGPLFAEDGLKGTRIRAITEKAGVNVAGINYHFGSKEKLYKAVVDFVFAKLGYINIGTFWDNLPETEKTKEGVCEMIHNCLKVLFTKLFMSDHPLWYFKIVHRVLADQQKCFKDFDEEVYQKDFIAVQKIHEIFNKNINEWEIEAWLAIWYGQTISMNILMPKKMLEHTGDNEQIQGYLNAVLDNTYIAITSLLKADKHIKAEKN